MSAIVPIKQWVDSLLENSPIAPVYLNLLPKPIVHEYIKKQLAEQPDLLPYFLPYLPSHTYSYIFHKDCWRLDSQAESPQFGEYVIHGVSVIQWLVRLQTIGPELAAHIFYNLSEEEVIAYIQAICRVEAIEIPDDDNQQTYDLTNLEYMVPGGAFKIHALAHIPDTDFVSVCHFIESLYNYDFVFANSCLGHVAFTLESENNLQLAKQRQEYLEQEGILLYNTEQPLESNLQDRIDADYKWQDKDTWVQWDYTKPIVVARENTEQEVREAIGYLFQSLDTSEEKELYMAELLGDGWETILDYDKESTAFWLDHTLVADALETASQYWYTEILPQLQSKQTSLFLTHFTKAVHTNSTMSQEFSKTIWNRAVDTPAMAKTNENADTDHVTGLPVWALYSVDYMYRYQFYLEQLLGYNPTVLGFAPSFVTDKESHATEYDREYLGHNLQEQSYRLFQLGLDTLEHTQHLSVPDIQDRLHAFGPQWVLDHAWLAIQKTQIQIWEHWVQTQAFGIDYNTIQFSVEKAISSGSWEVLYDMLQYWRGFFPSQAQILLWAVWRPLPQFPVIASSKSPMAVALWVTRPLFQQSDLQKILDLAIALAHTTKL
jgi:hypothetical protein